MEPAELCDADPEWLCIKLRPLTTKCVLIAVRLQWFLLKTLVRTTGSIVKLSLKPQLHGLFGIATSQLCDTLITQLPFHVHRKKGQALDCGDLLAVPNIVSLKPNTSAFFMVVNNVQDHIFAQPVLGLENHRRPFDARLCSRSPPLETSSTSVAMCGASSSTIKSDVSLAAPMRALSWRADLPRAAFLDRLATTRATAGFNRLPVFVDLLISLARDTALTRSLEKDAT